MIPADLVRADQQTMLIVGTLAAAQHDPAVWERFVDRMFDDWAKEADNDAANRASAANQAIAAIGRLAASRGTQPDMDPAATGDNSPPAREPVAGPAKGV